MEEQEKEQKIIDQIKLVFDPEIPVNVYDLGLVYNCEINLNKRSSHNDDFNLSFLCLWLRLL